MHLALSKKEITLTSPYQLYGMCWWGFWLEGWVFNEVHLNVKITHVLVVLS